MNRFFVNEPRHNFRNNTKWVPTLRHFRAGLIDPKTPTFRIINRQAGSSNTPANSIHLESITPMQHKPYHFITKWELNAPAERVFAEIYQSDAWPSWWKGVRSVVDVKTGHPDGIGDVKRYTWRSILPYNLTFDMELVEKIPSRRIAGRATGELEGSGIWEFTEKDGMTFVRYEWSVRTTRRWMNLLAPIARPFFAWNHDVVMRWGRKGLESRLQQR